MIKGRIILEFDTAFKSLPETINHTKQNVLLKDFVNPFDEIFDFLSYDDLDEMKDSFKANIDNYSVKYVWREDEVVCDWEEFADKMTYVFDLSDVVDFGELFNNMNTFEENRDDFILWVNEK